jgi:6-pyruvoyltetrahydropterin/6-carboxytetrahydropterin synthase
VFKVTKAIDFCYGHRLLNYDGKCRYLHGHNGRVEVDLAGERLDERGILHDFGHVKSVLKTWLDRELDHRMILARADPLAEVLAEQGEPIVLLDENPTAENLAKLIYERAQALELPVIEVRLWETPTSAAAYRGRAE